MHKCINNHRIHTLVALDLDQENLYYTHETRDTSNTPFPNIITIFRSAQMKNSNPVTLSTVRILYPPRMAGHSGFVHQAVCMGETLLRDAIYRGMNPKEAAEHFKKRYEEGNNIYAKYFKDNYDDMHMNIGSFTTPHDACVSIRLYYDDIQRYCKLDCEVTRYLYDQIGDGVRHVKLLDTAPPKLKKLCDSLIDGRVKGDLTGVPVVSIAREAVKEYNELEAKHQSACGQISEYEEENRKLKEKLKKISELVKPTMSDWDPNECLRYITRGDLI